jgi:hypothetical protein
MKEYHIKARVSDEEQIFTIDAPDPDDALRQAIEWANQDYVSIEVYTGHPTLGNPERISINSAPPPASSGTPIVQSIILNLHGGYMATFGLVGYRFLQALSF